MADWSMSAWQILVASGPMGIFILASSLLCWAIIMEKFIFFAKHCRKSTLLIKDILLMIQKNMIPQAIQLCEESPLCAARIFSAGLQKFGSTKQDIQDSMVTASQQEVFYIEQHLRLLITLAHLAPLCGFIGTALGIAMSFHAIHEQTVSLYPVVVSDFAAGMWQALATTILGLIVAIPSYLFYNYFLIRRDLWMQQTEQEAQKLTEYLMQT